MSNAGESRTSFVLGLNERPNKSNRLPLNDIQEYLESYRASSSVAAHSHLFRGLSDLHVVPSLFPDMNQGRGIFSRNTIHRIQDPHGEISNRYAYPNPWLWRQPEHQRIHAFTEIGNFVNEGNLRRQETHWRHI